jgi:hypothetical protein
MATAGHPAVDVIEPGGARSHLAQDQHGPSRLEKFGDHRRRISKRSKAFSRVGKKLALISKLPDAMVSVEGEAMRHLGAHQRGQER